MLYDTFHEYHFDIDNLPNKSPIFDHRFEHNGAFKWKKGVNLKIQMSKNLKNQEKVLKSLKGIPQKTLLPQLFIKNLRNF